MLARITIGLFVLSVSAGALAAPCSGFVDVDDSNATYCAAVTYIKNKGITLGCTDASHYCPSDFVTRLQMALFLERAGKGNAANTLVDSTATIGGGGASGTQLSLPTLGTVDCTSPPGGPCANRVTDVFGTVAGGVGNQAGDASGAIDSAPFATVGGGFTNTASAANATVGGGWQNSASGIYSTVSGGSYNNGSGDWTAVAGGNSNNAGGNSAAIGGGAGNVAAGASATVSGGSSNAANGIAATVAGGHDNIASGDYSFAAGWNTGADHTRCAVFGLWSTTTRFTCIGTSNVFKVGADNGFSVDYASQSGFAGGGGTRWLAIGPFSHGVGTTIIAWNNAYLTDAGVWVNASSSRASKTDLQPVDVDAVLRKVVRLPITTWRYREGEGDVRHIGPMAEDFWQAFKIGYGDQTIADLDARGVEFAAIQGLFMELKERDATIAKQQSQMAQDESRIAEEEREISKQQREIAELRERMSQVESLRGELAALRNAIATATKVPAVEAQVAGATP